MKCRVNSYKQQHLHGAWLVYGATGNENAKAIVPHVRAHPRVQTKVRKKKAHLKAAIL